MRRGIFAFLLIVSGPALSLADSSPSPGGAGLEARPPLERFDEALFAPRRGAIPNALTSEAPEAEPELIEAHRDLSFLEGLNLPDLPIRFDSRIVRYLESYYHEPRGRAGMRALYARYLRYAPMIKRTLEEAGLPEDLRCVAMAESGYRKDVFSRAGAAGMWQFISSTGASLGLEQNRFIDERLDPERATQAAAAYFAGLYERFGSWELALSAYNMGHGALLRSIQKYNTNDFWELSRLEAALPFETSHYVAKILACAIVLRNVERFGLDDIEGEETLPATHLIAPGGTRLVQIARAARITLDELKQLNPQLKRDRLPPGSAEYRVRIPESAASARTRFKIEHGEDERIHELRFGESLAAVAAQYEISLAQLQRMNDIARGEQMEAGERLFVPDRDPKRLEKGEEPIVVSVPDGTLRFSDKRRVFYRTLGGEAIEEIAEFFDLSADALLAWNQLDPGAPLPAGLYIQLFLPLDRSLEDAILLSEDEVTILELGSDEFFAYHEAQRGRVRFVHRAEEGETLSSIGERYGLSVGSLARINRFPRSRRLKPGDAVIVYAETELAPQAIVEAMRDPSAERAP